MLLGLLLAACAALLAAVVLGARRRERAVAVPAPPAPRREAVLAAAVAPAPTISGRVPRRHVPVSDTAYETVRTPIPNVHAERVVAHDRTLDALDVLLDELESTTVRIDGADELDERAVTELEALASRLEAAAATFAA